jgi:hypothetical protein
MVGAEVVEKSTSPGVVAHFITFINDFESECHGAMYDNTRPQAFLAVCRERLWGVRIRQCQDHPPRL